MDISLVTNEHAGIGRSIITTAPTEYYIGSIKISMLPDQRYTEADIPGLCVP